MASTPGSDANLTYMLEYIQNQAARVHVVLTDAAGAPVTGVSSPTVAVEKSGGAISVVVPDAWAEVTTGAFSGQGKYDLVLPASALDTRGPLVVAVTGGTGRFLALIHVVGVTVDDVNTRIGAPSGASVSADVATANARLVTLQTSVSALDAVLGRVRGLLNENAVQDQQSYDGNSRLTNARIRCYDSAANATAAGATGLIRQYTVTATYDVNGNLNLFRIVEG